MDTEYIDMNRSDMRAATAKVYEGSSTKCCCGCAGNYYETNGDVWLYRGSKSFVDQEMADTKIDEIVGKVFRNMRRDDVDLTTYTYSDGSQMIAVTMGRKVYILNTGD